MGNLCSIIFFFISRTVTDWIREILLPMSFKWWRFVPFSEVLLCGVYAMIWYQPVIDAHQLENGQKPQRLSIYFEWHNGVQKGKIIILDINPCIFCFYWVIKTSFYSKLKNFFYHLKIFKISLHHLRIPVHISLSHLYIIKCKVFRYSNTVVHNLLRKKEINNGNIFEFLCVWKNI